MLVLQIDYDHPHVIDLREFGLGLVKITNERQGRAGSAPRLGYEADKRIPVHRQEVFDEIERTKGATP